MLISLSSDDRKKIVLLHYTKDCLRILVDPLAFKPYLYSPISVCSLNFLLTFFYLLCQRQITIRSLHSFYIVIVSASRYFEESAHFADRVFLLMTVDHQILYACLHFLSVSERKSRINSFSISNLLMRFSFLVISYLN